MENILQNKTYKIPHIKRSKNEAKILYFLLAILAMYVGFSENIYAVIVFYAMLLCFIRTPHCYIPILLITCSVSGFFGFPNGLGMSRAVSFCFVASSLISIKKISNKFLINMALIFCTTFISAILAEYFLASSILEIAVDMLIIFCCINICTEEKDIRNIFEFFKIVLFAVFFALLIFYLFFPYYTANNRLSLNSIVNENSFSVLLMILAVTSFYFAFQEKRKMKYILLTCGYTFFIFEAGSRATIVSFIFGIAVTMILYSLITKKFKIISRTLLFLILMLIGYISLLMFSPSFAERYNILQQVALGMTGRDVLMEASLRYVIPQNIFFGVGLSQILEADAVAPFLGYGETSHNTIISMLAQLGIVGFVIFMFFYIRVYISSCKDLKNNGNSLFGVLLFTCFFINGMAELIFDQHWFYVIIGIMIITNKKKHSCIKGMVY